MIRFLTALLLGTLLSLAHSPAVAAALRVGYFVLPPHAVPAAQGDEEAPALRYFRTLLPAMGAPEVQFQALPLARLLRMLEHQQLDMALLLAESPERRARLVFASQPLLLVRPMLLLRAEHGLAQVAGSADLRALRIGVWSEGFLSPLLRDPRLQLQRLSGDVVEHRYLRMLDRGHLDAFYSPDGCALRHTLNQQAEPARYRLLALPEAPVPLYTVFSRAAAGRWQAAYERALAARQKQQPYELPGLSGCAAGALPPTAR